MKIFTLFGVSVLPSGGEAYLGVRDKRPAAAAFIFILTIASRHHTDGQPKQVPAHVNSGSVLRERTLTCSSNVEDEKFLNDVETSVWILLYVLAA